MEIPVGVKHWHGATARSYFTHIALMGDVKNAKNEWLEPVSDEQYGEANKQQQDK